MPNLIGAIIVVLLGLIAYPIWSDHLSGGGGASAPNGANAPSLEGGSSRRSDLESIIRDRLRGQFKFPGEVQFLSERTSFASSLDESGQGGVAEAIVCGSYSAISPMGVRGPEMPFHGTAYADHFSKAISVEVIFELPDGYREVSFGRENAVETDLTKGALETLMERDCPGVGAPDLGTYAGFSEGFDALGVYDALQVIRSAQGKIDEADVRSCAAKERPVSDCAIAAGCRADLPGDDYADACAAVESECSADLPLHDCVDVAVDALAAE